MSAEEQAFLRVFAARETYEESSPRPAGIRLLFAAPGTHKSEKMEPAMAGQPNCEECAAIARELAKAYAEALASLDPQQREAAAALRHLRGGTEEDAARVEELLANAQASESPGSLQAPQRRLLREVFAGPPTPRSGPSSRLMDALRHKWAHQGQTGHTVQSRKR